MPNNFIFDAAPQDLKTQIFGSDGGVLTAIKVSSDGGLSVSVINTPDVSVTNIPSVLVNNIPSVLVNNTPSVLVENIPSVLVNNIPSVLVNNIPSVLVNNTPSVEIHSVATTSDVSTVTTGTGTATVLAENTSAQKEYSYYIYNLGGPAMTVCLQVAPVNTDSYYVNDTATYFSVPANSFLVIAPKYYLNWTRLWYDTGTGTASFAAYYNAKV